MDVVLRVGRCTLMHGAAPFAAGSGRPHLIDSFVDAISFTYG